MSTTFRRAGGAAPPAPCRPAVCRHCGQPKPIQRQGLCRGCYFTPSIRRQYEPGQQRADERRPRPKRRLPHAPTRWPPGSAEKAAVMRDRVAAGFLPHHPGDAGLDLRQRLRAMAESGMILAAPP